MKDDHGLELGFDPFGKFMVAPKCPKCKGAEVIREQLSSDSVHLSCSSFKCDWGFTATRSAESPASTPASTPEKAEDDVKNCKVGNHEVEKLVAFGMCGKHAKRWARCGKPDLDKWISDGGLSVSGREVGVRKGRAVSPTFRRTPPTSQGLDDGPKLPRKRTSRGTGGDGAEHSNTPSSFVPVTLPAPVSALLVGVVGRMLHVCDADGRVLASQAVA